MVETLDEAPSRARVDALVEAGVTAIAVCFLFSFMNPAHEQRVRAIIAARHKDIMVSLSSEVDPAFREYERTCATAFDAYVKPVLARYLDFMERSLVESGVARRCRSCSRAAACARPRSRASGRSACSCRGRPPVIGGLMVAAKPRPQTSSRSISAARAATSR
ncbi:MAG: hydantoinase/oxoprolinase N-terminal domain-containing protein [Pseudomonadota bacterium]